MRESDPNQRGRHNKVIHFASGVAVVAGVLAVSEWMRTPNEYEDAEPTPPAVETEAMTPETDLPFVISETPQSKEATPWLICPQKDADHAECINRPN